MHFFQFALPALILLAGCNSTSAPTMPTAPAEVSAKVTTVCALYERAYVETKAALLPAPLDIVIGCPGRTSLKSQMSRLENAAAFRRAAAAPLPAAASKSDVGKRLFQRMISRGVPVEVATRMTSTPEFSRALAART
ncbi:hypothetical protein [uncultured Sulfitobacter sp.]|uniref:hypothetical protein n=1 Tax=uncultured Sulfitobacter sp. TaxID=191468 RepID=UPI0026147521|nr:hypothetical protein [uncultured Sulfitobacter sp.]